MLTRRPLTSAILASLLLPGLALAQDAQQAQPVPQPPPAEVTAEATAEAASAEATAEATTATAPQQAAPATTGSTSGELDRITVTGSRISRAGFDTLEPAQVIGRETIEAVGATNVAESLFRQPGFSAGASQAGNQAGFGAGVNFVSRFDLGSNRELVLVNGRRFVSSNPSTQFGPASSGLQVDLSVVPTALVERIESIGIGGAPTYGSDAISGVTNLILRRDFEGVEVSMGVGATDKGDNVRFNLSSTFGHNFADGRGNFTVTAAHDRNNGVLQSARERYRQGWGFAPNPDATAIATFTPWRDPATDGRYLTHIPFNNGNADGVPSQIFTKDIRIARYTWGGLLFPATGSAIKNAAGELRGFGANADQYYHFDNHGNLVTYNPGTPFGITGTASGGDGVNLSEVSQITSDLFRSNLFATASYAVNDRLNLFTEVAFFRAEARELVDQSMYNAFNFAGLSAPLTFSVNNPFLNDAARATLTGLGVTEFRLSRASRDLVTGNSSSESKIQRYVVGADGYFDIGQRQAQWEVSLNHGRADFEYGRNSLVQQNFVNAINVTRDANGNIVCDSSVAGTVADPNCVPLNLFGENQASAAAKAYVTQYQISRAENRQTVFNANMTLGLFDLPGGEFQVNGGYEQRHEKAAFLPSAFQQQGLGREVAIPAISGSYKTREVFLEAFAPLFGGDASYPGLRRLDLTLKGRHVDNSLAGKFNAFTYGLQWEPIAGLQLRGNKTRSFRAPSIVELLQPVSSSFFSIPEPCSTSNVNSGTVPAIRARNCQAFYSYYGVNPNTFSGSTSSLPGTSGGNPELRNEVADSWTAGIVWQPSFVPGLTVAADYYKIDIKDVITLLSPSAIASACFDNPDFNAADVPNANEYCSRITRNAPGSNAAGVANGINTQRVNASLLSTRVRTAEVNYRWNLNDYGALNLSFQAYLPKTLKSQSTPVVSAAEFIGEQGYPERQFQWGANWAGKHWRLGVSANYSSATVYDLTATNPAEVRDFFVQDSSTTWDANIGYRFSDNARINLAVRNVQDKTGFPYLTASALGRRFMLTTTLKF